MSTTEVSNLVIEEFKSLTGIVLSQEEINELNVYAIKRERFKQQLRMVFPNLRIRSSVGLVTVNDFIGEINQEIQRKKQFVSDVLSTVRRIAKREDYTLKDDIFAELKPRSRDSNKYLSESANYFYKINPVYAALCRQANYFPAYSLLEKCKNIGELAEMLYRRGKF